VRSALALAAALGFFAPSWPHAVQSEPGVQRLALQPPARVRIEAARFRMGSDADALARALETCLLSPPSTGPCSPELFADEKPEHDVYLAAFSIDRLEVENRAYLRCVSAGVCAPSAISDRDPRLGQPTQPVASISWREAERYCAWLSGRLPTEAQWERAARGDSARTFPWGRIWNPRLANHGGGGERESDADGYRFAAAVDAFPDGRSFYGLQNMAGNVWEFVADRYGAYDPRASPVEPEGASSGSERVLRGGSWRTPPHALRVTARARIPETERRPDVGFRCAYAAARVRADAPAAKPP